MLSPKLATTADRQVRKPLLCEACEQKFGSLGEAYTISLVRNEKGFRLLEMLEAPKARFRIAGDHKEFFGDELPLKVDPLV
jgi:hypothetical protein